MAVDTREKRFSLIGYGLPFRLTLPVADGSFDVGDRLHLLGLYAGIVPATVNDVLGGRIVAGYVFVPGLRAGSVFARGAQAGHVFHPGIKAGLGRSS